MGFDPSIVSQIVAFCWQMIPLWLGYVDDNFTAVHKDEIDDFHNHFIKDFNI